ncbi:hypothetical protein ACP70R_015011 [Stipagrostis hirtigluma subsp. patula]
MDSKEVQVLRTLRQNYGSFTPYVPISQSHRCLLISIECSFWGTHGDIQQKFDLQV